MGIIIFIIIFILLILVIGIIMNRNNNNNESKNKPKVTNIRESIDNWEVYTDEYKFNKIEEELNKKDIGNY